MADTLERTAQLLQSDSEDEELLTSPFSRQPSSVTPGSTRRFDLERLMYGPDLYRKDITFYHQYYDIIAQDILTVTDEEEAVTFRGRVYKKTDLTC